MKFRFLFFFFFSIILYISLLSFAKNEEPNFNFNNGRLNIISLATKLEDLQLRLVGENFLTSMYAVNLVHLDGKLHQTATVVWNREFQTNGDLTLEVTYRGDIPISLNPDFYDEEETELFLSGLLTKPSSNVKRKQFNISYAALKMSPTNSFGGYWLVYDHETTCFNKNMSSILKGNFVWYQQGLPTSIICDLEILESIKSRVIWIIGT